MKIAKNTEQQRPLSAQTQETEKFVTRKIRKKKKMLKLYFFKTNLTLGQYPLMLSSGCLWPSIVWSAGRDELLSFLINQSTISYRDPVKALFWNFHAIFTMRVFELGRCIIILCLKNRKQNREARRSRSALNRLINDHWREDNLIKTTKRDCLWMHYVNK